MDPSDDNHTLRGRGITLSSSVARGRCTEKERLSPLLIAAAPTDSVAAEQTLDACLGAHLARLEAQVAFEVLPSRLPNWKLADVGFTRQPGPAYAAYPAST